MSATCLYRTSVAPAWIDYNGHLRDGYYAVVFSSAIDALMDQVGLDADYRQRTGGTLYTLEMHLHFLHEVHAADQLEIRERVLELDHKRLLLALDMFCLRQSEPVACAEFMLLHVQGGSTPRSAPFPPAVAAALDALRAAAAADPPPAGIPRSRRLTLRPPQPAS